jgi:hypothetical protein
MSSTTTIDPADPAQIRKGAVVSGVINAVINGAIQAWLLSGSGPLPLTVDAITNEEHTVFGAAVPLGVSLAMILTVVAYSTVKGAKPPFYPTFLWMTVKNGFFVLGVTVTFAVLWQRAFGSILVTFWLGIGILGLIAGVISGLVNYMTIRASMAPDGSPKL